MCNDITLELTFRDLSDKEYRKINHEIQVNREKVLKRMNEALFEIIYGESPEEVKRELWDTESKDKNMMRTLL